MKKVYLSLLFASLGVSVNAQNFDQEIDMNFDYLSSSVVLPKSPLKITPIFIGGVDSVATFDGDDQFTGYSLAKQNNDCFQSERK